MTDSACALLWNHVLVDPTGHARPCCRWVGEPVGLLTGDAASVFDGPTAVNIRNRMLQGEPMPACAKCHAEEQTTGKSMRTKANARYPIGADARMGSLRFLELSASNLCNLQCVMCNSANSTRWIAAERRIHGHSRADRRIDADLSWLRNAALLADLELVKFTGGEPMMIDAYADFVEWLVVQGRSSAITLMYNINATVLPSARLLALWERFHRVEVSVSVDGIGTANDYIRHPSRWSTQEPKLRRLWELRQDGPISEIEAITAVSAFNVLSLPSIAQAVPAFSDRHALHHVHHPTHLQPWVYPIAVRSRIATRIAACPAASNTVRMLETMPFDADTYHRFLTYRNRLDEVRGTDFSSALPDLSDIITNHGTL